MLTLYFCFQQQTSATQTTPAPPCPHFHRNNGSPPQGGTAVSWRARLAGWPLHDFTQGQTNQWARRHNTTHTHTLTSQETHRIQQEASSPPHNGETGWRINNTLAHARYKGRQAQTRTDKHDAGSYSTATWRRDLGGGELFLGTSPEVNTNITEHISIPVHLTDFPQYHWATCRGDRVHTLTWGITHQHPPTTRRHTRLAPPHYPLATLAHLHGGTGQSRTQALLTGGVHLQGHHHLHR